MKNYENELTFATEVITRNMLAYCKQFTKCSTCKFFRGNEEKCKKDIMFEVLNGLKNNNNNVVNILDEEKMAKIIDEVVERARF